MRVMFSNLVALNLIFLSFPLPFVDCFNNIDGFLLCFFPHHVRVSQIHHVISGGIT